MVKKIKLEFPKAESRYWYLYWIGKFYFENNTYKVDLHFVNKYDPDLDIRDFTRTTFIQRVNASNLLDFHIGVIFDSEESELVNLENQPGKNTFNNLTVLILEDEYKPTKNTFPLIGHSQFPIVEGLDQEKVPFMKFRKKFLNGEKRPTIYSVLVPSCCLIDYFFFQNSKIIYKILSGELLGAFKFDDFKVVTDPESNKRIARLRYDNTLISRKNAIAIVPYLFLKNQLGIKMLNSIYSSLLKSFKNNKEKVENVGAYIDTYFTTGKYKMKLQGISYNNHRLDDKKDKKNDKIFLVSKITKCEFFGDDLFEVDEILLIPAFPNKKNEDNSNDNATTNNPEATEEVVAVLDMYPNKSAKPGGKTNPDRIDSNQTGPFNIPVKIELLTGDKRNLFNIPSGEKVDGVSTDEWGTDFFGDLRILQQEAQKVQSRITYIDNLEYFARVVEVLKTMGEEKGISINDDPLGIGRVNYPYELRTQYNKYLIDTVEIRHEESFFYAVELGRGFIGVFNDVHRVRIEIERLESLLWELVSKDEDQPKIEKPNYNQKKGVRLWTIIHKNYKSDFLDQDIEIKQGVQHQRVYKSGKKTAFQRTAEIILEKFPFRHR